LRVSVVLITWNSAPYLRRCLAGIAGQSHRDLELIVVDNASSDDSLALARDANIIIRNQENRGFAAAANQGIAAASGEFVVLINPDCFLTPDYIEKVIAAMSDDIGSATGTLIRAKGNEIEPTDEIDSTGIRMTRSGRHLDDNRQPTTDNEVFGVSAAAAVYRMSFLRDVAIDGEIFDEDFFAYREDADLAWRGRLLGWRALHVADAIAYHVRHVTPERRAQLSPLINMHSVKNRFLLRWKNEGAYLALRNFPFESARDLVVLAAVLTVERSSLPALAWLWKNRRRVMAKRREIQRRRRVSDRAVAVWFR
jgi:GT2 family glycosyltransferase